MYTNVISYNVMYYIAVTMYTQYIHVLTMYNVCTMYVYTYMDNLCNSEEEYKLTLNVLATALRRHNSHVHCKIHCVKTMYYVCLPLLF